MILIMAVIKIILKMVIMMVIRDNDAHANEYAYGEDKWMTIWCIW